MQERPTCPVGAGCWAVFHLLPMWKVGFINSGLDCFQGVDVIGDGMEDLIWIRV